MLNRYKKLLSRSIVDDQARHCLENELMTIGRVNGFEPIPSMSDADCERLEFRFIGNYEKVLAPIYEAYDKAINLSVPAYDVNNFYYTLARIKPQKHTSKIFLALINRTSYYDVVGTTIISYTGVAHFLARFDILSDLEGDNCCSLI